MDLNEKVIVITGGAQGLGRAMALELAGKGAWLALVDLSQDKLDEAIALCKKAGGDARGYLANIAREDEVVALFNQVVADFGSLHGVINNAGILRDGLLIKAKDGEILKKMSLAEWQAVIDVNLTGVFL
jgi:3-oxoacyl-[acyl-carrier protein] reductase